MPAAGRPPRQVALVALLAAALAGARPAGAQTAEYLGRRVTAVRFDREGTPVDDPDLVALAETRVGEPLRLGDVRETLGHLFSLGRYEDVRARASRDGEGVMVTYELVPIHRVQALEFRGRLALDASLLRGAVTGRLGPAPPVGRANEAVGALEDLYREYGYRHPTIAVQRRIEHHPDRATLIFEIDPGQVTRVGEVTFEGEGLGIALARVQLSLRRNQPFRQVEIDQALAGFRADLQSRGYYDARVNALPRFSADESTVDLTVLVETGPLVRVRFEGDPLPAEERDELVPIAREQSADEDLLEDSKLRIEARLQGEGYRDALADYRREASGDTLTIVFTVTRGPLYRLDHVEITGSDIRDSLRELLRLNPGQPFVDRVLDADVASMRELYRREGFADARIEVMTSSEAVDARSRRVTAVLAVAEGPRAAVGEVRFRGAQALDEARLRDVAGLRAGQVFYEPDTTLAADALAAEYADLGFQNAVVQRTLSFSEDRRTVDVEFDITEGVQAIVDEILVAGNTRTRTDIIERELAFAPGDPLGRNALIESQRRLGALGLFRRIEITSTGHPGDESRRDVLVTVEEAPATTLSWGGGPEGGQRLRRSADGTGIAEERFEFGARGFFEIGRRNLWGKNRSVNLFGRLSVRPRGESVTREGGINPSGFSEYRVLLTYREPRIFGTTGDGQLAGVLEQGIRSSFNFSRRVLSFEVGRRLGTGASLNGRYSLERTRVFDEQPNVEDQPIIDRLFPQVRLSSFSSTLIRDTRGDPIDPVRGTFMTIDAAVAARAIGSEVGFVKTLLKGFVYRQVAGQGRLVLAAGSTLGLANGFSREAEVDGAVQRIEDLPASERFYAGGDTTVRGFALDRLGTRETIDENGFPKGGHALLIFNTELRARVWGALGAVGFLDAGNVFATASDLDVSRLRGSVGFGLRYRSPIGPIRIDLGFKLSRFAFRTGRLLADGTPETRLEPRTALHISLGQAF